MNSKLNVPEDIGWGRQHLWKGSLKSGAGWMMLVFLTDIPGMYLIDQNRQWPLAILALIAMVPVIASVFYVRGVARWIRGMDELQRQLTLESWLFATVSYLILGAAWSLLNAVGVWESISGATGLHLERMPFANCSFIICMTYVFWGVGFNIINRRFK